MKLTDRSSGWEEEAYMGFLLGKILYYGENPFMFWVLWFSFSIFYFFQLCFGKLSFSPINVGENWVTSCSFQIY